MTSRSAKGKGKRPWHGPAVCGLMALLTALGSFLPYIIQTGGFFTLSEDFNTQQIPFLTAAAEGIKALPGGEWVWNLDLGSSLITGLGYYNLGSPFTLLALPFSREAMPYTVVWLLILKYMTAAVTAELWLRRFVKREACAVLGGLLYAFSGFQSTNLLFHFHDITALFPLMMLGLDRLTEERKGLFFSFAVFLNCLVNPVFFVQEAVFTMIYFLFRNLEKGQVMKLLKTGGTALASAALGVLMAASLFLPNAVYLLDSVRGDNLPGGSRLLYGLEGCLFILKGFLLPGEAMREQSMIFPEHFLSTSAYLPFFGMSFVLIELTQNRGWLRRLLTALILVSFSPLMQSGFMLFTETFQRWWFMLSLLFALATARVLDQEQYRTRKGLRTMGLCTLGTAAFCVVIWKAPWAPGGTLVIRRELYFLFVGIGLGSSLLCFGLACIRKLNVRSAAVFTVIACVVTTGAAAGVYRRALRFGDYTGADYRIGMSLEAMDEQYRYREVSNLYTVPGAGAGVGSFTSTKEKGSYEFLLMFAPENRYETALLNTAYLPRTVAGLPELLGGRYRIADEPGKNAVRGPLAYPDREKWIVETEACPIGFASGAYITLEELKKADADQRAYLMMQAVPVESAEQVSGYRELRWEPGAMPEDPKELIRRTAERRVHDFHRDGRGFTCTTDYGEDQLVFFSVPWDAGWRATIDGEEADIMNSCGMMALNVPGGSHSIAFSYHTPGFRLGMILSAAGWAAFLLLGLYGRKRRSGGQTQV